MNVFIVSMGIPGQSGPSSKLFYVLKYLASKYDHRITLGVIEQKERKKVADVEIDELSRYCTIFKIGMIPPPKICFQTSRYVVANLASAVTSLTNILKLNLIHCYTYSPRLHKKIRRLVNEGDFDIAYTDSSTLFPYINRLNIPKVVDDIWAASSSYNEMRKVEGNILRKAYWLLRYHQFRNYEAEYSNLDAAGVVTNYDRDILQPWLPRITKVVSFGIDIDEFKPVACVEDSPSLLFIGSMSYLPNIKAVLYFHSEIFPLIRHEIPETKFYVVGRNPTPEITSLAIKDESVVVTGYVEDIRPYIARSSLVVNPMTLRAGIKTRLLEAMAMGKTVISTPVGAQGFESLQDKALIVADTPQVFAEQAIALLHNKQKREEMGIYARKVVEEDYSWQKIVDNLAEILEAATKRG